MHFEGDGLLCRRGDRRGLEKLVSKRRVLQVSRHLQLVLLPFKVLLLVLLSHEIVNEVSLVLVLLTLLLGDVDLVVADPLHIDLSAAHLLLRLVVMYVVDSLATLAEFLVQLFTFHIELPLQVLHSGVLLFLFGLLFGLHEVLDFEIALLLLLDECVSLDTLLGAFSELADVLLLVALAFHANVVSDARVHVCHLLRFLLEGGVSLFLCISKLVF